jgi:hypothetical protein
MNILSISNKEQLYKKGSKNVVNDMIKHKKHVFILIYMEGCGPCNATRPEWSKMSHTLKTQYAKNNDIVIIDINEKLLPLIKNVGTVSGFPSIKYITDRGNVIETYEDSSIKTKDRSSDSFINWVESKVLNGKIILIPVSGSVYKRLSKKQNHTNKKSKRHNKGKRDNNREKYKTRKHRQY